jgi:phosphoglucomutase
MLQLVLTVLVTRFGGAQCHHCLPVKAVTHRHDYLSAYIPDLPNVIDMDAIRAVKISPRMGLSHGTQDCCRPTTP